MTTYIVIRKPILMEDEGRYQVERWFDSREEFEEWWQNDENFDYFFRSNYVIGYDSR